MTWSFMAGLLAVLFGVMPARADESVVAAPGLSEGKPGVHIEKVEVGFQGLYKVGEWTPLWVTVHSQEDRRVQIVVDAPDPDDNMTLLPGPFVDLKSGMPVRIETCFRTGRLNGELQVEVRDSDGRTLAARRSRPVSRAACWRGRSRGPRQIRLTHSTELRPALKLDASLWVTLGKFDLAASFAESQESGKQSTGANPDAAPGLQLAHSQISRLESLPQLPADSRALQSVDLLILPTGRQAAGGDSILDQMTAERDALVQEVGCGWEGTC